MKLFEANAITEASLPKKLLTWFQEYSPRGGENTKLDDFLLTLTDSHHLQENAKAWKAAKKVSLPERFAIQPKNMTKPSVATNFHDVMQTIYENEFDIIDVASEGASGIKDEEMGELTLGINIRVAELVHPVYYEENGKMQPYILITDRLKGFGEANIGKRYTALQQIISGLYEEQRK